MPVPVVVGHLAGSGLRVREGSRSGAPAIIPFQNGERDGASVCHLIPGEARQAAPAILG